jgi:DNA polymerase-4
VVSASAEARELGIAAGLEVARAQEQCPGLIRRPTDLKRYRAVSARIRSLVREANERSEAIGLDGWYLDWGLQAGAERSTAEIAARIRSAEGVPVDAGLGPTRFVAHLAAHAASGTQVNAIAADAVPEFVGRHPVTALWGLGPTAAGKLAQHGVQRVAQLRALGGAALEEIVGPRNARAFLALAQGEDRSRIAVHAQPKSLSRERTLPAPEQDRRALGEALSALARELEEWLERERCEARGVRLELLYEGGERATRSATPQRPVARQDEIAEVAHGLLERTQVGLRAVHRLRLQLVRLAPRTQPAPRQLRLF